MKINFNKPYLSGKETEYIKEAVKSGKVSGDGIFTKKCHDFFQTRYNFNKCLLTTSCTDALELSAILIDIKEGDEVIMPSFTFVSTANAFVLRGAKIVFADSESLTPNIDVNQIEGLITSRTKAIVPVHYAGIACDMDPLIGLAKKNNLSVIEDAAQAVDSFYNGKPLGSIGDLAAFSFHETKNIISGEGGMIVINDPRYTNRSEIIREKGTNRSSFFRGEVDKYGWVDVGSSFLPSDIIAAYLFAQLENIDKIQSRRKAIWERYFEGLSHLQKEGYIKLPFIPSYASNNGHMFYMIVNNLEERSKLIDFLKKNQILSVFHYLSLHKSPYYLNKHDGRKLENSDRYSECLLRLPFYYELEDENIDLIINLIDDFFRKR